MQLNVNSEIIFKVPITPKCFFRKNESLHLFETHRGFFFLFLTNPAILEASKVAKIEASFVHDRVRRGVSLFLFLRHKLIYIALTLCKDACKVDCNVKTEIDPLPFSFGREQKMLGFSQLPKPIKWQDLLEKKNGRNASRTGAKIHFSEKNILGLWAL